MSFLSNFCYAILILVCFNYVKKFIWRKHNLIIKDRFILVTGGSQGLGLSISKYLVKNGARKVVIIARNKVTLAEAVKEIEKFRINSNQKISFLSADLSNAEETEKVFQNINDIPDIIFACAGHAIPGLFIEQDSKNLKQGVDLNYFTALWTCHSGLKKMLKNTQCKYKRHIILLSSVTHFYSFIGYAQYAPLKSAIRSLADILRQECLHYNIDVDCVFPGNFLSKGYEIEELTKPEITKRIEGPSNPITADECASIIMKKIDNGNQMITTDFIGSILNTAMLSGSPRSNYLFEVLFGIIFIFIAPIVEFYIQHQIKSYYKKRV